MKLFDNLLDSTLWGEPDHVLRVWLTLLLECDKNGNVRMPIPGLARRACVSVDQAADAIRRLEAPDPYSNSDTQEGRRILRPNPDIPAWHIVNYLKYRGLRDEEARRDYQREWDRVNRPSGHARQSDTVRPQSDTVRPDPTQGEGEGEGENQRSGSPEPLRDSEQDDASGDPLEATLTGERTSGNPTQGPLPLGASQPPQRRKAGPSPKTTPRSPVDLRAETPDPDSEVVFEFPCSGPVPVARVFGDWLRQFQSAFPGIQIFQETAKAHAWILANPAKRKTARGVSKFLFNWYSRAQNGGGR